ncbi:uncharacterized protein LOC121377385 [Gigantopelta aegis]|uniref:uncharacterized protein LOC121377385 n=1 Tax=Gigantopelta aegis TaxID=1735272 RepID=UPI001B88D29B|nr:uncharacterized protein LOC121377385 [Gigantopelta aegis]XP_041361297.1 uncharacterized protein LOC121377385 [Gigantopelta aegis]
MRHIIVLVSVIGTAMAAATSDENEAKIAHLEQTVSDLTRQLMLQQLFVEERVRSDGDSGVKQIRRYHDGTRDYYGETHAGSSILAIHDHANYDRTIGMGEFIGVLNGVEFRTRHNDYKLRMPSKTKDNFHATEEIPFPDVPPQVLAKSTVADQIKEMREWFKAWKTQNHAHRDYRKYFKPVLCYLEGAWTTDTKSLQEPFTSDRHHLDANSWFDLQEKVRFTSYTGVKSNLENFAYLPTTIMNMINGSAQFAQWNYRILCHPLSVDVPLRNLKPIDELSSRLPYHRHTMASHVASKAARFYLNDHKSDAFMRNGYIDKLMHEIPGKDNYPASLTDDAFGLMAYDMAFGKNYTAENTGYYHRWYKVKKDGAMGVKVIHRGFADENLWVAQTTQPRVAGMGLDDCNKDAHTHVRVCHRYDRKYTFAIPMEIIYLTPLSTWNPYNLTMKGAYYSTLGKTVEAHGRNGGLTMDKAYDGINSKYYYKTPVEFFHGGEVQKDAADTAKGQVGVLDPQGNVRKVVASGHRIFFPSITGLGVIRQRYPIMPVHGEGSAVWKELNALKEMVMKMNTYAGYYEQSPYASSSATTSGSAGTATTIIPTVAAVVYLMKSSAY